MTPNEIFFGLITAAIIALVIVLIWLSVRLGEAIRAIRAFLETAEHSMQESLEEVNQNLRTLRTLTGNINTVADDIASFSGSIREIGGEVKQVTVSVKEIGEIIQGLGTETLASVYGLRAGLRTGFEVFLKNLFHKGATR
jgi:uncharacterized protein YoxC